MYRLMCLKCGNTQAPYDGNKGNCIICGCKMEQIPDGYGFSDEEVEKFLSSNNLDFNKYWEQNEQRLFDEVISKSPEFDINLYNNKDSILQQKQQQQEESINRGKAILEEQNRVPKCPSCGSANISKIGVVGRAVSFKLVGFASSKIGKTHKCNNCGTMW